MINMTIKEMNLPVFITLDEDGIDVLGNQTYKIKIQDNNLEIISIDSSDIKRLLKETDDTLWKLLTKKSDLSSMEESFSKEEVIQMHLDRLDESYQEGVQSSIRIVNNLIAGINAKSTYITGNKYILSITPTMSYYLEDWFRLWDQSLKNKWSLHRTSFHNDYLKNFFGRDKQSVGMYYEIMGNEIFVIISDKTIPSIVEGNGEAYVDKVLSEEIYEHEYYKSETLLDYSFKMLGYKKTPEGWTMLFEGFNILLIIEEVSNYNYQYVAKAYKYDKLELLEYINTVVDLDNVYKKLGLL